MPFTSKSQMKKCFAMKRRGQAKGWDCKKWAKETPNIKNLPDKKEEQLKEIIKSMIIEIMKEK